MRKSALITPRAKTARHEILSRYHFCESAQRLRGIYDLIAERSGSDASALAFVERIEAYVLGFDIAQRGTARESLGRGMRVIGFEKRVTIIARYGAREVEIVRVYYGGQDWEIRER